MADDVELQSEGSRTLHLKELRVQWQVVALQTIATLALIWRACVFVNSPQAPDVATHPRLGTQRAWLTDYI